VANLRVLDATGVQLSLKATGTGTEVDPLILEHSMSAASAGQKTMVASTPVVLPSDQSKIPVEDPFILATGITRTSITCTIANTDYAAGAAIPAGTVRILVHAATYLAVLSIDTTTASVGLYLGADIIYSLRVTPGNTLHAQSPTAGTVIYISYLNS
jgi:hypothetical protein